MATPDIAGVPRSIRLTHQNIVDLARYDNSMLSSYWLLVTAQNGWLSVPKRNSGSFYENT